MAIWFSQPDLRRVTDNSSKTLAGRVGIEFLEMGDDFLRARMPVDERTIQPAGILHGGASVVLAETLGSVGAYWCIDPSRKVCVGLEVNANHVRSVRSGYVYGTAKPIHIGGTTQLWEIRIEDEEGRLVCISRLTMAILDRK